MSEDVQALLQQALEQHQAGDAEAAESLYRRVLDLHPDHVDARYLLGTVLLQRGRFDECVKVLRQVTAARPDVPDAHNNLGVAYQALGRWEEAARAFQAAVAANPEYEPAFYNLGSLMQGRKLYAEAEKCYRQVLELKPKDEQALVSMAFVLTKQERLDEAEQVYEQILATNPGCHQVHNSLSYIYDRQGRLDEAVAAARRSIEIEPGYAEGYNNLGTAFRSQGRLDEACDAYRKAIELAGEFPLAEFNFGTTKLLAGDYVAGWPGYAHYAAAADMSPRKFSQPCWDGEAIEGRRLFVYADQGFGDTLQFVRFLASLKERSGAHVIFECPPKLQRLLNGQAGAHEVIAEGDPLPDFDVQISLSKAPELLGVTLDSLPGDVPYVSSTTPLRQEIQQLLDDANSPWTTVRSDRIHAVLDGKNPMNRVTTNTSPQLANRTHLKVGLVWQGNPQQARDVLRSCPLQELTPLTEVEGVTLFSLQTGKVGLSQLAELGPTLPIVDLGSRLGDFAETAAVLQRLDLLITVDTSAAHLAGALGRPVWTLLCNAPDWRWHLDRDDSPWYPTMHLFRQPRWGDWQSVVREVAAELAQLVSQ